MNTHPLNHAKKAVHVKITWGKYGQLKTVVVVTNADIIKSRNVRKGLWFGSERGNWGVWNVFIGGIKIANL